MINGGVVTIKNYDGSTIPDFKNLLLFNRSFFTEPITYKPYQTFHVKGVVFDIDKESGFITGNVSDATIIELSENLSVGETSTIIFDKKITITTGREMYIYGDLNQKTNDHDDDSSNDISLVLHSQGKMFISEDVYIHCHKCVILSEKNLQFKGIIKNHQKSCIHSPSDWYDPAPNFHCLDYHDTDQTLSTGTVLGNFYDQTGLSKLINPLKYRFYLDESNVVYRHNFS